MTSDPSPTRRWKLASVIVGEGGTEAALVVDDHFYAFDMHPAARRLIGHEGPTTIFELLQRWAQWEPLLTVIAGTVDEAEGLVAEDVILRPPVPRPGKVFCAGANYASHVREMGAEVPDKSRTRPYFFMKPSTAVSGPNDFIRIPPMCQQVDWEIELAAYMGKTARNVPVDRAVEYVAGYTILNDISARDTHRREDWGQGPFYWDWLQSKGCDTFAPTGPYLVPRSQITDPYNLRLSLSVNDEMMQDSNTNDLIFNIEEQIAYLSSFITLEPGDIISTGTPPGVGMPRGIFLKRGDEVVAAIEQIGILRNRVM
jgi:2-keto-4-pentenoate hydratase/2-oxohepta-3-ene-1,7-dioic acid hydratase in catechol pathway